MGGFPKAFESKSEAKRITIMNGGTAEQMLNAAEKLQTEGIKFDQDKLRYDLIPGNALDELAKVYTFGAKKYADRNWEKGMAWSRIFGAIMRHAWAWFRGQTHDPETGLNHMVHAAWGCLALVEYSITNKGQDDRVQTDSTAHLGGCI